MVHVAAAGRLWGRKPQRGLNKTTDGGKIQRNVFFINEDTGAGEVVMDRTDPESHCVATCQRRRPVFGFNGSGPYGAVYKTTDDGATCKKFVRGLPYENELPEDTRTGCVGPNNDHRIWLEDNHSDLAPGQIGKVLVRDSAGGTGSLAKGLNSAPLVVEWTTVGQKRWHNQIASLDKPASGLIFWFALGADQKYNIADIE